VSPFSRPTSSTPTAPAPARSPTPVYARTIGIDARAAVEVPAGRGRVVRELLCALAARPDDGHRYVLYARQPWAAELDERFQWRSIDARDPWWHVRAARAANRECDVFLSTNSYLTTGFLRVPAVPIVYDLTTFEPAMHPNRRSRAIERLTLGLAVRRSAALLSISQATAEALVGRFPGAASRTVVGHLGVAPALSPTLEAAEAAKLPPPGFVLAVGTLEPRKNLPRLVAAYAAMDPHLQAAHPLVVVGALGWDTTGTLDALRSLGERCTRLGYVSDAALAECYRRCAVFCYPSLGEGFGLPVLEAMAAGATVLTSNVSSLPEVGGEAVAYADPAQVSDISAQLQALLGDEGRREELSTRARARAEEFSWGRFAQVTLETLERAARGGDV
jgi:glycosyltransferase involved in cell wall biosynthesis